MVRVGSITIDPPLLNSSSPYLSIHVHFTDFLDLHRLRRTSLPFISLHLQGQ